MVAPPLVKSSLALRNRYINVRKHPIFNNNANFKLTLTMTERNANAYVTLTGMKTKELL